MTTTLTPAQELFLKVVYSHLTPIRERGRIPYVLLIHEQEAARWGWPEFVPGETTCFGIPVEYSESLDVGCCMLRLDDGTQYRIELPVWFTED